MARLVFIGDPWDGRTYEFMVERTTVGRSPHNTLTLQDPSISQSHCEILVFGREVIVRDLGSSNGTIVHGTRLHEEQRPLRHGEIVQFGRIQARLELEPAPEDFPTDITAVHSFERHRRAQRDPNAKPADPSATLGPAPSTPSTEQTFFLRRDPATPPLPPSDPPPPSSQTANPAPRSRLPRTWIAAFLAFLILALTLVWLLR